MYTPQEPPPCVGKIWNHYGRWCSNDCPATALCVFIIMATLIKERML